MEEELTIAVAAIRADKALPARDEASVKIGVVLRLLRILGWDPFDVSEVAPEYSLAGKRVDFALRVGGGNKVFVEVKRPAEDLEPHQEQLLNYSFAHGVRLAALTNGPTWWLYLPLSEGSWEHRRFYTLDLMEQDSGEVARRFIEFLSKGRVVSGEAATSAEQVYGSTKRRATVLEALPRAWEKLLSDPNDDFVALLMETTERICGLRPEVVDVEAFLKKLRTSRVTPEPFARQSVTSGPARTESRASARAPRPTARPAGTGSVDQDFTARKVESYTLFGRASTVKTMREVLLGVASEMYKRHRNDFDKILDLRGTRMIYFSKNRDELKEPKQVGNSPYYAETKLNANSLVRRCHELLGLFGYAETDLQITAV
jgi:predicted type IV restriction endonuclease